MHYIHMRERHPIDDLFRRVLDDAESAPPRDVWHSVQRRRGWLHRMRVRADRNRPMVALVLLVLLGGGAAALSLLGPDEQVEPTIAEHHIGRSAPTPNTSDTQKVATHLRGPGKDATPDAPARPKEGTLGAARTTPPDAVVTSLPQQAEPVREREASPAQADIHHAHARQQGKSRDARTASRTKDPAADEHGLNGTVPEPVARSGANVEADRSIARTGRGDQEERSAVQDGPEPLNPRRIEFRPEPDSSSLLGGGGTWAYVLERGTYWLGSRWSVQGLDGGWRGPEPLSEELDRAETWRTQFAATLCFGRRWRSGVSVATGIEYAQRTSRFLYDEGGVSTASVLIDTVWSGTPSGTATIYTWEIDSALVMEPGGSRRYSSTDRYSYIRVPLELGWHKEIRRWSLGGRLGAAISIPLNRRGSTLAYTTSVQDGTIEAVDLRNEAVSGRFGAVLSITMAIDAGHQLSEHWSIHAGPTLARDLVETGSTPRPDLWALGAFFGVEFELPSRERVRNAVTTTP